MKKFYKKFTSKHEMVKAVADLTDKVDTDKMLEMLTKAGVTRTYVVGTNGAVHACDNTKKFISLVNALGDLQLLHPLCFGRGEVHHIYSKVDYFNHETSEEPEKDIHEKVEEVVNESLEESVIDDEVSGNDFSKYESIYDENDKRGSKDKLERIVREEHGIDLRKNQPFDKMLEELKASLEA